VTSPPLSNYANEIYLAGVGGQVPALPTDPAALEAYAQARVDAGPFWYAAGAAGAGATHRANLAAFDRWRIVPRMLADATARTATTTLFGHQLPAPIVTAPIGVQGIMHADGELAVARVAAELGFPMAVSTV
jgi:isopentenyl diphosphate isomerase/L-lactate dehydrogenase-like FMN-dependent dehydrogenase